jgi:putative ABC transport system permease protein
VVLAAAAVLAVALGLVLALMLVAMLQHVFDPPPDHLAIPWEFLARLAGAVVLGTLLAVTGAARSLARMPVGAVLREE